MNDWKPFEQSSSKWAPSESWLTPREDLIEIIQNNPDGIERRSEERVLSKKRHLVGHRKDTVQILDGESLEKYDMELKEPVASEHAQIKQIIIFNLKQIHIRGYVRYDTYI